MAFSAELAYDQLEGLQKLAPYLSYASRLATFKYFSYNRKKDATCTSKTLARAGWISTVTRSSPHSAKCPFCRVELVFDYDDDPWEEHKYHSPKCEFVIRDTLVEVTWTLQDVVNLAIRCATNEKYKEIQTIIDQFEQLETPEGLKKVAGEPEFSRIDATQKLLELRKAAKYLTYTHRLESFEKSGKFQYDNVENAKCTSKKLAEAGWYLFETDPEALLPSVKCPFCLLELDVEESDDPWEEHKKHGAQCDFVKLDKLDENLWSMDEAVELAVRILTMETYKTGTWLVEEMETLKKHDEASEMMELFMMKASKRTSVGS